MRRILSLLLVFVLIAVCCADHNKDRNEKCLEQKKDCKKCCHNRCCDKDDDHKENNDKERTKKNHPKRILIVVISTIVGALVLITVVVGCVNVKKRKQATKTRPDKTKGEIVSTITLPRFSTATVAKKPLPESDCFEMAPPSAPPTSTQLSTYQLGVKFPPAYQSESCDSMLPPPPYSAI